MKNFRKIVCILLCICMCLSILAACSTDTDKQPVIPTPTPTPETFAETHNKLSSVFADAPVASELLQILDSLIEDNATLDVEAYTEKLVTALVTYDLQNATAMAEQYKMDTIGKAKTYEMDLAKVESESVTRFVSRIGDEVSAAAESISRTEDPIYRMYALSNLQTALDNYTSYRSFLLTIATSITGNLQVAAENLSKNMETTLQLFLQTDMSSEFYFTTPFFLTLKEEDSYTNDSYFKLFVDSVLNDLTTLEVSKAEPITTENAWKKAYLDWLKEDESATMGKFALLHINADDIPELYYTFNENASTLCSYNGSAVIHQNLATLYYIEKKIFFLDSGGRMGVYYDTVYALEDGTFQVMHNGEFNHFDDAPEASGERVYTYLWDSEKISEEEYERRLNTAFAKEQATPYEASLSYEEIVKAIVLY